MIPFPKMHIAQSVINRVVNALNDKESPIGLSAVEMAQPPVVPNPAPEGVQIDQGTMTPAPPATAPPDVNPDVVTSSALGESPLAGALVGSAAR